MKDLIISIAQALVDMPNDVKVTEVKGGQSTIFELHVAKSDVGKIIGRQGRTADAIRTLLAGISAKNRKKYMLEIIEYNQKKSYPAV